MMTEAAAATPKVETTEYLKMVRRMIKAGGRRVGHADEFELAELLKLHEAVDEAVAIAIAGQRSYGRSWDAIAVGTQTTRQAAHARWSDRVKELEQAS